MTQHDIVHRNEKQFMISNLGNEINGYPAGALH